MRNRARYRGHFFQTFFGSIQAENALFAFLNADLVRSRAEMNDIVIESRHRLRIGTEGEYVSERLIPSLRKRIFAPAFEIPGLGDRADLFSTGFNRRDLTRKPFDRGRHFFARPETGLSRDDITPALHGAIYGQYAGALLRGGQVKYFFGHRRQLDRRRNRLRLADPELSRGMIAPAVNSAFGGQRAGMGGSENDLNDSAQSDL